MKEFAITSKAFEGLLEFGYDTNDKLIRMVINAQLDDNQLEFVRQTVPWTVDILLEKYKSKTLRITETTDISFDRFWNDYGHKKDKEEAIKQWNKLTRAEQIKAIVKIPYFKADCASRNVQLVYPCRYLSKKRYNDE